MTKATNGIAMDLAGAVDDPERPIFESSDSSLALDRSAWVKLGKPRKITVRVEPSEK